MNNFTFFAQCLKFFNMCSTPYAENVVTNSSDKTWLQLERIVVAYSRIRTVVKMKVKFLLSMQQRHRGGNYVQLHTLSLVLDVAEWSVLCSGHCTSRKNPVSIE